MLAESSISPWRIATTPRYRPQPFVRSFTHASWMLKYADSFAAQIATSPLMPLTPADITSPSSSLSSMMAAPTMCSVTTTLLRSQSAGIGFGGAVTIASDISFSCFVVSSAFSAAFLSSSFTLLDGATKRSTEYTSTRLSTTFT